MEPRACSSTNSRTLGWSVRQRGEKRRSRWWLSTGTAGRPAGDSAVAVSSFAWGVRVALNGDFVGLGRWPEAEKTLIQGLEKRLGTTAGESGDAIRPLSRSDLDAAFTWLAATLDMPINLVSPPSFAVRAYEYFKEPEPPAPLLLNSFFLADLARAKSLFAESKAPATLQRYMSLVGPDNRWDLLNDAAAL